MCPAIAYKNIETAMLFTENMSKANPMSTAKKIAEVLSLREVDLSESMEKI